MKTMFITVTTSQPKPDQAAELELFLANFLPRLERSPGVAAIYHYARPEQGGDITLIIWESKDAVKSYREGSLFKEASAFEKELSLETTREGYPLAYAENVSLKSGIRQP
jgi:heme-degrading monooxygenase HmoA